jgi:hypothetical protein
MTRRRSHRLPRVGPAVRAGLGVWRGLGGPLMVAAGDAM